MGKSHKLDHKSFRVSGGKKFRLKDHDPGHTGGFKDKAEAKDALIEDVSALADAQELLWASRECSVIIIFQGMDAAGKDGTIKHVMSGVNPQGVDVLSFKAPTDEERLHHFLWRPSKAAPARGRIAIFNRSYYEEVLVVRVHPELLEQQWLSKAQRTDDLDKVWAHRFEQINMFERIFTNHGCIVLKFFLHLSKGEQRKRFLERLTNPEKCWKFSVSDYRERQHWDDYQAAFEDMLRETSTDWAPWYVIPADKKWFMRACVADIIAARIGELDLSYPKVSDEQCAKLEEVRKELEKELN